MRWIEFDELKITYEASQAYSGTGHGFFDKRPGVSLRRMETSMFGRYGYVSGKATPKGLRALADEMAYDLDEQLKIEALIATHLSTPQQIEPEWDWMMTHLNERIMSGDFDDYQVSVSEIFNAALLDSVVVVVERDGVWSATVYPSRESAWTAFDELSGQIHAGEEDDEG
jgi:hypothetical protein